MDLRLLGPIELRLDGRPIELGPRKQRAVLAMLALEAGRTVSANRLVEGLRRYRHPRRCPDSRGAVLSAGEESHRAGEARQSDRSDRRRMRDHHEGQPEQYRGEEWRA